MQGRDKQPFVLRDDATRAEIAAIPGRFIAGSKVIFRVITKCDQRNEHPSMSGWMLKSVHILERKEC